MGVRLKSLISAWVLVATFATAATAQDRPTATFRPRVSIPDEVDREFFGSGAGFQNIRKPLEALVGIPNYPENLIARDADDIDRLYRDLLTQQVSNDPLIRTADLPNPFATSVQTLPAANVSGRVLGSELVFEKLPGQ